jgi:hypothetical protein
LASNTIFYSDLDFIIVIAIVIAIFLALAHPRSRPGRNAPGYAAHLTTANASIQLYFFGGLPALYSAKKMGGIKTSTVAPWFYGNEPMFTVMLTVVFTEFLGIG